MSSPQEKEERFRRLSAVFSTMPNLDNALKLLDPKTKSSEWLVVGRQSSMASGSDEFEIGNGQASFDFKITQYVDFLNWTSDLPDFLSVVTNPIEYQHFLDFFQRSFPDMLYGSVSPQDQRPTVVDLSLKGRSAPVHFDLGVEKDRAGLLTHFVARPGFINTLTIGTPIGEHERPYWFNVSLFAGNPNMARLGLGLLHSKERGWNSNVLEWAISTNVGRDKIGDIGISASNLGDIIHAKMGASSFVPKT